ncbi:MAG TPA: MM0924 family protein [Pyrinomonadaceae bacterium]|nr:MM0924 family protein [Pyrinomonadaceae bacterium]
MEDFLKQLMGKKIDVSCGTSTIVRGDVVDVKGGVLYLRDDHQRVAYVPVNKIAIIWEVKDSLPRPGFVG